MALMTEAEFEAFFEPYACNVDGFYEAAYWRFSDELIKNLVRRHLAVCPGDRLLDAGGGTGRWAAWYAQELGVTVTVADKSRRMLAQARELVASHRLQDAIQLVECDLHDAPQLESEAYDAVMSTYGVLSFLDDPPAAFRTLFRVLKPGGRALLMSHSLVNALVSKVNRDSAGAAELAELMSTQTVKWAPHVPQLRVYTAEQLRVLATSAGFTVRGVFGVTTIVHPGPEDFGYPYTKVSDVSRQLADPDFFRQAMALELAATEHPEWVERAVNLMLYVERPEQ